MNNLSIYLAGNIQKGHEKESQIFWSQSDRDAIQKKLSSVDILFLNPSIRKDDLSDQMSVFGRDMTQVYLSDLVFVDARERRGLGLGAEMMWAKIHRIPILTLAPMDSHYRKSKVTLLGEDVENWVHPFVDTLSDAIVTDLNEACAWMDRFLQGNASIKDLCSIQSTMQRYKDRRFSNDEPMKKLINKSSSMQKKFASIS
jgi:hypothetical protein